ncbi:MAG: ABC transporter substrate-binding protein [Betaproteobacteria bacterium]
MMDRRSFITSAAGALLAVPLAAEAQQPGKVWRIGLLSGGARPPDGAPPAALRQALQDLGYVDGRSISYVGRWAETRSDRLPGLAAELVDLKVDLIVTLGGPSAEAARSATSSIPIIITGAGDAVGTGLIASLARPGANVTGISEPATELSAKRLELLKEAMPKALHIAVLWNAEDRAMTLRYREIEKAARLLGVTIQPLGVREPDDFDVAFSAMTRQRPDAVYLVTDALTTLNRKRVIDFAAAHRVPAMYENGLVVRDGGLMSYGPDLGDNLRRAAVYVDRILKGAKPGELPVEQPNRYYLLVNLKTAKALGLPIPQSLLLRADEVIQ